ncbi:MAG: HAMP domain-containing sensor histidine kinase [Mycobacteriales bacterium]
MSRPKGDDLLVRQAARGVALQAGALVATAMLLLVALVSVVVVRSQAQAADRLLRETAASADDVGDPPPGAWLVLAGSSGVSQSPGLPRQLEPDLSRLRASAADKASFTSLSLQGKDFRVVTQLRDGDAVQVVLDLEPAHEERNRLFRAMVLAAAVGLLLAIGVGVLLGRRAVAPLAEALALQRTFVADASHELRTPLTLLSTRAQLLDRLLRQDPNDPQLLADSQGVVHDVERLGDVVEDLLVAADPRADAEHVPLDLGALVAGVAASARPHAEQAGVQLTEDLPDEALHVSGSQAALRRAVLALVDNAIDHTPQDGTVTVRLRRDRRTVVLAVSDTGPGIAPEDAERVLQRFHSGGHRAGRRHYGLGLALTHDVANRHGGQLRLAAAEVGTTFELVLPAFDG